MILPVLLLAGVAASAPSPFPQVEPVAVGEAAERAARRGVGPVEIRHDKVVRSDILVTVRAAVLTPEQFACLDAVAAQHDVELPAALQPGFDAVRDARRKADARRSARNWLAARNLLDHVPDYVPDATDPAGFARAIEVACGPRATGAFQSTYGPHTFDPDWLARNMHMADDDPLPCLLAMASAARFETGFIGNEAVR
ncbi:hypothetical protein FHS96_000302 [Sphingomonas zeicaulis]|uniref:hypothetical protein n=1 Tax=Sphingomonas zeicaulis TaxID=1632740 RepID=UPI003D1F4822